MFAFIRADGITSTIMIKLHDETVGSRFKIDLIERLIHSQEGDDVG